MLVCGVTGRLYSPAEIAIVDDIVTTMSSADARLWPFKIARLAAAYGGAMYGAAATLVASEGAVFGARRFEAVANNLVEWKRRAGEGTLDDDALTAVIAKGTPGFGVLYGPTDPRFDALLRQAELRGRGALRFATLSRRAASLARQRGVEPHAFVAVSALCLDLEMTPVQVGLVGMLALFHVALAHAGESARVPEPRLQEVPLPSVRYVGSPPRTSPRHQQSAATPLVR
jgi:hypothetical protein